MKKKKINPFVWAEATGYICRPDGSQIICSLASPGEVTWHNEMKWHWEKENT